MRAPFGAFAMRHMGALDKVTGATASDLLRAKRFKLGGLGASRVWGLPGSGGFWGFGFRA